MISSRDTLGAALGSGGGGHVCEHENNPAASLPHTVASAPPAENNKITQEITHPESQAQNQIIGKQHLWLLVMKFFHFSPNQEGYVCIMWSV